MIRGEFIKNQVLKIYRTLPELTFPMDAKRVFDLIPNCEYYSYQDFAAQNGFTVEEVSKACASKFGCTIFNKAFNRYLVLCNQSTEDHNNHGRQRWTRSHELGHILCKHYQLSEAKTLAYSGDGNSLENDCEAEADLFASIFLAPFPLFKYLNVNSPVDAQNILGLSYEASVYTFDKYIRWKQNHLKKAWENDMVRTYLYKTQR